MTGYKRFFAFQALFVFLVLLGVSGAGAEDRPWLGVTIQGVTDEAVKTLGLEEKKGVLVSEVSPASPAEKAGLKSGDVIVRINGKDVDSVEGFVSEIQKSSAGSSVDLDILREGTTQTVSVTLGELPEEKTAEAEPFMPGPMGHMQGMMGSCGAGGKGGAMGGMMKSPAMGGMMKSPAMGGMKGMMSGQGCGKGMQGMAGGCPMHGMMKNCPMMESCPMHKGMQGMMKGMGPMQGMMKGRRYAIMYKELLDNLDLTEEQRAKVRTLMLNYQKRSIKLDADIKIAELDLRELLAEDPVNLEKVRAKIYEIASNEAELRFFRYSSLEELKKILDEEQRKRLKSFYDKETGSGMGAPGVSHTPCGCK